MYSCYVYAMHTIYIYTLLWKGSVDEVKECFVGVSLVYVLH